MRGASALRALHSLALSEDFKQHGARALQTETLMAAAGAALRVFNQILELLPHHIVWMRRDDWSRVRRQSVWLHGLGLRDLSRRHRSTSCIDRTP